MVLKPYNGAIIQKYGRNIVNINDGARQYDGANETTVHVNGPKTLKSHYNSEISQCVSFWFGNEKKAFRFGFVRK